MAPWPVPNFCNKNEMPTKSKSTNAKKAEKRSADTIQQAVEQILAGNPEAGTFYSVQKVFGNGEFLLRNAEGREARGVGGHGGGRVRMGPGNIVLAIGNPQLGLEIAGVITSRASARALIKQGAMKQAVLTAADGVGAVSSAPVEEDGYVFADEEEEVDVNAL